MKATIFAEVYQISEKEEKMYEAVLVLLSEGKSTGDIKVSDITERAGIGKGTAYEYFKSKEELIAKAILYGIISTTREIEERVERAKGTRERYIEILNWMEEVLYERKMAAVCFQIMQQSFQISGVLKQEVEKNLSILEVIAGGIRELIQSGKREGCFKDTIPEELQVTVMMSNLFAYWGHMNRHPEMAETEELNEMKEYLFRCLVRDLNDE